MNMNRDIIKYNSSIIDQLKMANNSKLKDLL